MSCVGVVVDVGDRCVLFLCIDYACGLLIVAYCQGLRVCVVGCLCCVVCLVCVFFAFCLLCVVCCVCCVLRDVLFVG